VRREALHLAFVGCAEPTLLDDARAVDGSLVHALLTAGQQENVLVATGASVQLKVKGAEWKQLPAAWYQ